MNILLLAQFYPPDIGGEERHVRNLAVALATRGHGVQVVTTALPAAPEGDAVEDGVRVRRVRSSAQSIGRLHSDASRPHALPLPDPRLRAAIGDLLRTRRFDVAHAHNWIVNSALGPVRAARVPLVLTLHDYSHVCATKRFMRDGAVCEGPSWQRCAPCASRHYGVAVGLGTAAANAISRRRRARTVSEFLAVSAAVAHHNELERAGVRYEVVPNFVPDDIVAAPSAVDPDGPLLYLGDVSVQKGVPVLFDALRRMPAAPPLVLAGRVEPGIDALAPPSATLLGPRPHEEVAALLASARAVVAPSVWPDPCPTVVLEAMASGRAVVASASGGIVDMVDDGVTGLLVPPGDADALAAALTRLVDDPRTLQAMGDAGRSAVAAFTTSAVVDRVEAAYRRAMAAR
jgi:glycosyltransferase involved in cell wall biosynthesis